MYCCCYIALSALNHILVFACTYSGLLYYACRLYTLNEYYNFQVANFTGDNELFTLPASVSCESTALDRLDDLLMESFPMSSLPPAELPRKLRQAKVELVNQYLSAANIRFPEVLMAMI